MLTVWIVMRNGEVDEVFSNEPAAIRHQRNLVSIWAISEIIEKTVNEI